MEKFYSKILVILLVGSLICSVAFSFYKYYFFKDFPLYIKASCYPEEESCFLHICEEDDMRCSSLPEGKFYYKIIYKKQFDAPPCSLSSCEALVCGDAENECLIYFCSKETKEEFEIDDSCSSE